MVAKLTKKTPTKTWKKNKNKYYEKTKTNLLKRQRQRAFRNNQMGHEREEEEYS